jgi:hypothetical protein
MVNKMIFNRFCRLASFGFFHEKPLLPLGERLEIPEFFCFWILIFGLI